MRMFVLFLLFFAIAAADGAPAPFSKPGTRELGKSDLDMMQGKWLEIWIVRDRTRFMGEAVEGEVVVVEGNHMKCLAPDGSVACRWTFTLNPAKTPKHFDRLRPAGEDLEGTPIPGVYHLGGGLLVVCSNFDADCSEPGWEERERPAGFDTSREGLRLSIYARPGHVFGRPGHSRPDINADTIGSKFFPEARRR